MLKSDANPSKVGALELVRDENEERETGDAAERTNLHDSNAMSNETQAALLELLSEPDAPAGGDGPKITVGSYTAD